MNKICSLTYISSKYKPSKNHCRAIVNPDIAVTEDRDNFEIACMILGYKNIYYTKWPQIVRKIDPILKQCIKEKKIKKIFYSQYYLSKAKIIDNEVIMIPAFIEEKKLLIYTPEGKKNALLFLKKDLESNIKEFQEPGSWLEEENHYLAGLLLEYNQKDITFFYMLNSFKNNKLSDEINCDIPFTNWTKTEKNKFLKFRKNIWKKSENYKLMQRDKVEAKKWLKQQNKFSINDLKKEIKKLKNNIKSNLLKFD